MIGVVGPGLVVLAQLRPGPRDEARVGPDDPHPLHRKSSCLGPRELKSHCGSVGGGDVGRRWGEQGRVGG